MKRGVVYFSWDYGYKYDTIRTTLRERSIAMPDYDEMTKQWRQSLIERIIQARTDQGLTQAQLAKMVGIQRSNISRLESGAHNPSLDFLLKARVYDLERWKGILASKCSSFAVWSGSNLPVIRPSTGRRNGWRLLRSIHNAVCGSFWG